MKDIEANEAKLELKQFLRKIQLLKFNFFEFKNLKKFKKKKKKKRKKKEIKKEKIPKRMKGIIMIGANVTATSAFGNIQPKKNPKDEAVRLRTMTVRKNKKKW